MLQIAEPRSKLSPPDSRCTSFVKTLMRPLGGTTIDGDMKVGPSSDTSVRCHPVRSWLEVPWLTISTYSSGSCRDATPSKKMQTMTTLEEAEVVGLGVTVGAGVAVRAGVGVFVGVGVGLGLGVG